jgi:hypothetical protein
MHQWFIMRNTINKCICWSVHFLHYKQRSLLHVLATYCQHRQGSVLWRIYYTGRQNNFIYMYKMLRFKYSLKYVLKYKILIKLFVLNCISICCVWWHHPNVDMLCMVTPSKCWYALYGDTIQAEVVSPYIQKRFWAGFKQVIVISILFIIFISNMLLLLMSVTCFSI